MAKITLHNKARGPRGLVIGGRHVDILPGESREVEISDEDAKTIRAQIEKGNGDISEGKAPAKPEAKSSEAKS